MAFAGDDHNRFAVDGAAPTRDTLSVGTVVPERGSSRCVSVLPNVDSAANAGCIVMQPRRPHGFRYCLVCGRRDNVIRMVFGCCGVGSVWRHASAWQGCSVVTAPGNRHALECRALLPLCSDGATVIGPVTLNERSTSSQGWNVTWSS